MEEDLNYCNNSTNSTFNDYININFQVFKALDSTCSHLHQRLQNSCKAPAIFKTFLKYVGGGNLYLGP